MNPYLVSVIPNAVDATMFTPDPCGPNPNKSKLNLTPNLIIQILLTIQEQMYEWCSENW